jgi:hypothetical protein
MKTLITSMLTATALLSFSSCTTVENKPTPTTPYSTTTTTERSTVQRPSVGTTETKTTRTY